MNLGLSFLSGIVGAFTPCVIVLFPILLYRFFNEKDNEWFEYFKFIIGFLVFYIIFGYLLSSLFNSSLQNGIKFGVGFLFIVLGILGIFKKVNPMQFPLIKNPLLLGMVFSLIVSFNPCTLPYLSIIVAKSSNITIFSNLIAYSLGLIFPSLLFAFFGKRILAMPKRAKNLFHKINILMNYILVAAGIYLVFSIDKLSKFDIYIITLFLLSIFFILLRAFFMINEKSQIFRIKNIFLFLALILIMYSAFSNCSSYVEDKNRIEKIFEKKLIEHKTCGSEITNCSICMRCIYIFSTAIFVGFIGILLFNNKKWE